MTNPVLATRSRAGFVEREHHGRVAIVDRSGALVAAIGDVDTPFLPRSSCKILQAIPLVESGAADKWMLSPQRLAFSCASHQGSDHHARLASTWLAEMGLGEADLMCGPQPSADEPTRHRMRAAGEKPAQVHNNCSGKHSGFLCLAGHLGAPTAGYIDPAHAVQRAIWAATEEMAEESVSGYAIDGCSAPNLAISVTGLARAMARIAAAETALSGARREAAIRLRSAMATHPFEVAGEGRACTELMRAGAGRFVVKTGAEGVFTAILPDAGLGVALKIDDGNTAAAESVMAGLLVALGALDDSNETVRKWREPQEINRRGTLCGGGAPTPVITGLTLG